MKVALYGVWHVHASDYTKAALQHADLIGFYEKDDAIAAAYQQKMHYGLDALVNALKGKTKTIFMIVTQVLTAVVFAYFFYYSIKLYQNVGPKILTTTLLSYRWIDAAMIYGFGMMFIYNIVFLVQDILSLKSPQKEEETE